MSTNNKFTIKDLKYLFSEKEAKKAAKILNSMSKEQQWAVNTYGAVRYEQGAAAMLQLG